MGLDGLTHEEGNTTTRSLSKFSKFIVKRPYLSLGLAITAVLGLSVAYHNLIPSSSSAKSTQDIRRAIQSQYDYVIKTYDLDTKGVIDTSEVRRSLEQTFSR